MDDPEFHLIDAIGKGDHHAFEQLIRRYQIPVCNFICRYLGSRHAAEDLAQEVFLKVYRAAPRFQPRARVSTWIFKIAYNLSMSEMKHRTRYEHLHDDLDSYREKLPSRESMEDMEARELKSDVSSALEQLPENQRAALLLRVNEELSYKEISEVLSVSVSSVESLIFRARERMRAILNRQRKE